MATSGYMSTSNAYIKFYVVVTTKEQSVSENWTSVNVDVYAVRTNTGYTTWGSGTCTLTVNGQNWSTSGTYSITSSAVRIGGVSSLVIPHNSDGTKTLVVSAALNMPDIISSSVQSYSVELSTIPRASHPTIGYSSSNIGSSYMDSELRIFTHRVSASFRHKITAEYAGNTVTLCNYTDDMGNLGDVYYTFPTSIFAAFIPTATSATCTVYLETFSGPTSIGKYGCSFSLVLPDWVAPTISSLSTEIIHNYSPSAWGIMINGKSSLKVTINGATPGAGAYITQYYISGGGYVGYTNPYTTGTIGNVGILGFSAVITDSRGRTASANINSPTIYDYNNPYSSGLSIFRCTSAGVADENGTYLSIKATANYASCNSKNSYALQYRTRETGGTWSAYTNLTNNTAVVVGAGAISIDKSYEVGIRVADYFTESIATVSIPTGYVTMDFKKGGKGVAFGKVAELDNTLDIAWNVKSTGRGVPSEGYMSGCDLNSFTTKAGTYGIYNYTNGPAGAGASTTIAVLEVILYSPDWIIQRVTYIGADPITYQRSRYAGTTWRAWQHLYTDVGGGHLTINRSVEVNGPVRVQSDWLYTTGATGWYNETYGGGWHMTDTSWLRAYKGKSIYTSGEIQADTKITTNVVQAWAAYIGLGRAPAYSWNGALASGASVTVTHNLGYYPIISLDGSIGNLIVRAQHLNTNQLLVYNYSSGGGTWTGNARLY